MSKQSQIKAYFKLKTADEMEAEEFLFSQASKDDEGLEDVEEEVNVVPPAPPPPQAQSPRAKH